MSNQIDSGEMRVSYKNQPNYCFTLAFFIQPPPPIFPAQKAPEFSATDYVSLC
jgi:hypothetical protein